MRLSVTLDQDTYEWIVDKAAFIGMTPREFAALTLQAAWQRSIRPVAAPVAAPVEVPVAAPVAASVEVLEPDGLPPMPLDVAGRKARFLKVLGYDLGQACADSGIGVSELEAWRREDLDFARRADELRIVGLARVEKHLEAVGRGSEEGNVLGLVAILNAHHPAYGKQARETVDRVLIPFGRAVVEVIRRYLGPDDLIRFAGELESQAAWAKRKLA